MSEVKDTQGQLWEVFIQTKQERNDPTKRLCTPLLWGTGIDPL